MPRRRVLAIVPLCIAGLLLAGWFLRRALAPLPEPSPPPASVTALLGGEAPGGFARATAPRDFRFPDEQIGTMSDPYGRPFLKSSDFVKAVAGASPPLSPPKPMRNTDVYWSEKGLNVRSTLWAGARGGAAMTSACFKLLHLARRPIWPWVDVAGGLLVEAFPMAQLRQWGLPYNGYGKQDSKGESLRGQIIDWMRGRIDLNRFETILISNADALDSVLCVFSGLAVYTSAIAALADESGLLENAAGS